MRKSGNRNMCIEVMVVNSEMTVPMACKASFLQSADNCRILSTKRLKARW